MPTLVDLERTCPSHPSQWEARTPDGGWVYIRYRWSILSWGSGISLDRAVENSYAHESRLNTEHDYDGEMWTLEMLHWLPYLWPDWKPLSVKFKSSNGTYTLDELNHLMGDDLQIEAIEQILRQSTGE